MNKQPTTNQLPTNIVLDKWSDIGFFWQGQIATDELIRLKKFLIEPAFLNITCKLQKISNILWLEFQVEGVVKVLCQRCLNSLAVDIGGLYRLALLKNENEIAQVEDFEYLLLDEIDMGSANRMLPIKQLLEDELLLVLPMSPRHDDCQIVLHTQEFKEDTKTEKDNPFAVLSALKNQFS